MAPPKDHADSHCETLVYDPCREPLTAEKKFWLLALAIVAATALGIAGCVTWYYTAINQAAIAAGLVEVPNAGSGYHWEKR